MEEKYIVSARKYRPSTFASVVGQKALTATLRNAIATNRLAHAYLFCGGRGVGKTSTARIFAKTINCEHPTPDGDPCNECHSCRMFNEGRSLNILELDAASNNSVNDIRELADQVRIPPNEGRYRVFIIDEVHMLTSAAFNAFLKTLEEPPSYVIFILATTEKHKIIPTILSRCQIYDFNRITISDIIDHLTYVAEQEGIKAERSALNVIAQRADGAMRDALSIFDQVAASSRGNITYQSAIDNLNVLDESYYARLFEAFRTENVGSALTIYKEIRDRGFDSHFFVTGLAQYLRDLMLARDPQTLALLDTDDTVKAQMAQTAAQLTPEFFYQAMSLCNSADMEYRQAASKTFLVELLLIRLCQLTGPSPISDGHGEGQALRKIEIDPSLQAAPAAQAAAAPSHSNQSPAPSAQRPQASSAPSPAQSAAQRASSAQAPAASASASMAVPGAARRRHVSLTSAFEAKPEEAQAASGANALRRRSPFTAEQLLTAWDGFMEANNRDHPLYNTMRAHKPQIDPQDRENFKVVVINAVQVGKLEECRAGLLQALRSACHNDYINFTIEVDEHTLIATGMTDSEALRALVERTPAAAEFIQSLKLTLT